MGSSGSSVSHKEVANPERPPLIKVAIFGPEKVGKSSLISQFKNGKLDEPVPETVAIDYAILNASSGEQAIRLMVWDCSGRERYWMMVPMFTRDAPVVVAVYDITSEKSLHEALRMIEGQAEQATVKSSALLVGNKVDLDDCEVASSTGEELAKRKGYVFMETCALTGENVSLLFEEIARVYQGRDS